MHSILVVDDELSIRESFTLILEGKYEVFLAASGEAALKTVADKSIDLAYLDIRMPGLDGLETLKRLKEIDPELEIVMVTAVNDVQKAGEAVKLGARDYVVKPFDVDKILKLTELVLRKKAILVHGAEVQKRGGKTQGLTGRSEKITEITKIIDKITKDERVLILGEIGTEKEIIAQMLHDKSGRSDFPFQTFHLSPGTPLFKIRTELLGREKGMSTADLEAKTGLLEKTKNGTLFVNNLESLPEETFKDISSPDFSRIGGAARIPLSARLIGGAAPDLADKNKKVFDFFAEVLVQIPPLRERASDIPLLVNRFIEKYNKHHKKNIKISPSELEALSSYSWPGNTHELECLIELFVLSCGADQITLEDLPLDILLKTSEGAGSGFLQAFEQEYIQGVFERTGKSKEKTAAFLGIRPAVLETKI